MLEEEVNGEETHPREIHLLWGQWPMKLTVKHNDIQWGEQVFDTLLILQVFLLTKHVEVCNFYHRYTSTVRDGI